MKLNKAFLRFGAVALVVGGIGLGGLVIARSQGELATVEASDTVTVAERSTVTTGSITVTLDAVGSLEPVNLQTLTFGASAAIQDVRVSLGDYVEAGTVLATLDTTDAEANIRQSEMTVTQRQASLDALLAPAEDIDIQLAEAQVSLAQAQMANASSNGAPTAEDIEIARLQEELALNSLWQSQINRDQRVAQEEARGNGVTWVEQQGFDASVTNAENSVTTAQMNYDETVNQTPSYSSAISAQSSLTSAQANLQTLLNGATADEIRAAEIEVERAQLSLDNTIKTLQNYAIIAPFDGVIAEETLTVGALPSSEGAITLLDPLAYTLDLSIAEADVVNVEVGQRVTLDIQALPDAVVTGTVTRLDVTPSASGQLVTYIAEVTLDPAPDVALRPGMSATASITLSEVNNVVVVPNRFITTDDTTGATTVMVETSDGVYTAIPVTIGARNSVSSEITSGITVGQTLVVLATASDATTATGAQLPGLGGILGGAGGGPAGGGGNFTPPTGGGGFPGGGGGRGG